MGPLLQDLGVWELLLYPWLTRRSGWCWLSMEVTTPTDQNGC